MHETLTYAFRCINVSATNAHHISITVSTQGCVRKAWETGSHAAKEGAGMNESAVPSQHSASSRLRNAAFAPIGDEGRAELVETRLLRAISSGDFIEGDRLPSENELAQLFGVAVVTVREALGSLRHRGVIETRRGRNGGSFVRTSLGAVTEVNATMLIRDAARGPRRPRPALRGHRVGLRRVRMPACDTRRTRRRAERADGCAAPSRRRLAATNHRRAA